MRRRPQRQDTVHARATSELALHQLGQYLHQIIDELSEREIGVMRLRYGLGDEAFLRTWDEIAQIYGVTRERVRQIELKTIQKLANRHGDSDFIRDLLDAADYSGLPAHVEERALGRPRGPRWTDRLEAVFCRRHQAQHVLDFGERQCPWCSCIASRNSNGRRRMYCSNACRQAAYRARKNSEQARDL